MNYKMIRRISLLSAVLFLAPFVTCAQDSPEVKRILVLYWYDRSFPGHVRWDQSFQAALESASSGNVEYYPEFLEANRFPGENQSQVLSDFLRQKYADRKIDVVVAQSGASLDFLLMHRHDLFPDAPIVFYTPTRPAVDELSGSSNVTGIVILTAYRKTLDLALRLHPDTEQVFVISGSLECDKRFEEMARQDLKGYETDVQINYLTDLSESELISKMKSLPERSIVLYVWQQSRNEQGKILETADIFSSITSATRAPIYGMSELRIGMGIVGGYVYTIEGAATAVAEMSLRIANGERAEDIPIANAPTVPMFDWNELKRWGISEKSLPPASVVRFRVPTLWDEYKWYAIALIFIVIIQSVLIMGLVINRTMRKKAEEALREAKESLTIAVEASQMGTWDLDLTKDYSGHRSLRHDQIFGYDSPQTTWGREIARRHILEEDLKVFDAAFARAMETGELEFEARLRWPDGSIHWMAARGRFYSDKSGQPTRGAGVNFDITERKRAEEALRESEERFRNMADKAPVMIWVSDINKLRPIYFNQQWLDFTGRTLEEELGSGWADGVHPLDYKRYMQTRTMAWGRREPFTLEYRLRRADGQFRWILDSGAVRLSPDGNFLGYIGSCIDITERKEAEESLANLSGQLIRAREDECARIARELHDDVNQRMALVLVELAELAEDAGTPVRLRRQLKGVMSRIAETSREIHRMSYDLHPAKLAYLGLVTALESLCEELHQRHGLKIRFTHEEVPADLPRDISLCLYRIVQECLNNVIRHSGVREAKVQLRRSANEILLDISDSGIGFDPESPETRRGLGLISMRERLRLIGGSISIDSDRSRGTRIAASAPLGRMGLDHEDTQPGDQTRAAKG